MFQDMPDGFRKAGGMREIPIVHAQGGSPSRDMPRDAYSTNGQGYTSNIPQEPQHVQFRAAPEIKVPTRSPEPGQRTVSPSPRAGINRRPVVSPEPSYTQPSYNQGPQPSQYQPYQQAPQPNVEPPQYPPEPQQHQAPQPAPSVSEPIPAPAPEEPIPAPAPDEPIPAPPPAAAPDAPDGSSLNPNQPQKARSVSPAPPNLSNMGQIEKIMGDLEELSKQVETYQGTKKDKQYLYMEEMLTRLLLKLDNIDSEGIDEVRQARRLAVKRVQAILDQLELKGFANAVEIPKDTNSESAANSENANQSNQENNSSQAAC